jgi:membrane-bound lytic murein transglycosylase D
MIDFSNFSLKTSSGETFYLTRNDFKPTYSRETSVQLAKTYEKSNRSGRGRSYAKSNYTIRKGETLSSIAKRHGTTVKKLCKLNNISGSSIREGQQIKVK